ncbi:MAG: sigma-70 family RNA polymerase sigma factor [Muribaculaceae bacterium]|nr:sigma-70 family RNA polymerase sigma factor [Muribaculaceae bacterium]
MGNNSSEFKSSVLGIQGNLLSFALKLTANKEEAQDLVQDTTLKALRNEEKFVENTNFKGWMLTIMRNIFINNYRKNARENTMVDSSEDLFHINLSQDSGFDSPDDTYAVNEITAIIAEFAPEYRDPFNMHVAGYKYEEIAEKLSTPLGTVKSRIFYARRMLREILSDYR